MERNFARYTDQIPEIVNMYIVSERLKKVEKYVITLLHYVTI